MSYTPTTWADNDVITVQKLNKMEQGLAEQKSEVFIIDITTQWNANNFASDCYLNKTYSEIKTALLAGKTLIVRSSYGEEYDYNTIVGLYELENIEYCVSIENEQRRINLTANSANGQLICLSEAPSAS